MDEIKLKPCPFCGRIPMVDDCGDNRYFVRCKCGMAQDKLYGQKCDAVRRWNTRKPSAAVGEKGKTMDEIMNEILSNPHDKLSIAKNLVSNYSPQVLEIALLYAHYLDTYGVSITEKKETAVQQKYMLDRAYVRGRQDERNAWMDAKEAWNRRVNDENHS